MTIKNLFFSFLFLLISMTSFGQEDPVIMSIDGKDITKSEFLQIYLKNNKDPKYDQESLDEYIQLFTRFKLKVAEAEALGYDTLPKLVAELNGYKKQLALPYLIDSTQNDELVKQAYYRTKNEIHAAHILIKVTPKASPQDTLIAYNKIMALRKRVTDGEDFGSVAASKNGSEDPSAIQNKGDLGYFTAFQMVYPFEEGAYNTEVGQVSMPIRTRFGYHIIKVLDKRPARGTIETAHIMVATTSKDDASRVNSAKEEIDEIYQLLLNGENFESLVVKYSDDPSSKQKGGLLPAFGTGTTTRMVSVFEDAAFALKNDGDFSKPIKTQYGWHIIKRIKWYPVPSFEEMKEGLESRVAKDERSKTTQNSFVEKLKVEYKFKDKSSKGLKWFKENLDSTFFKGKFDFSQLTTDKPLFIIDKVSFGQQKFVDYISLKYRTVARESIPNAIDILYKEWEKKMILDYEESKLPSKYPAYKALITEYHDGILLYEIMSDKVWNKAMTDTTNLKAFFEERRADYMWGKRIDAQIYEAYSSEDANKAFELLHVDSLNGNKVVKMINGDSSLKIKQRKGKFDLSKTAYLNDRDFKVGINDVYEVDGKFYVVVVNEILAPTQKEFSECKGSVTSNYQNYLEEKWIDELSKSHEVTINKEELYKIGE